MKFVDIFLPLFILQITVAEAQDNSGTLSIVFMGLKNQSGFVQYHIYRTGQEFDSEKPFKMVRVSKASARNGILACTLNLPDGIYGLSAMDDENANGEMDYNLIGLPKEGFSFSNYYHQGFSRPKFQDFKFEVKNNRVLLNCKFRYI